MKMPIIIELGMCRVDASLDGAGGLIDGQALLQVSFEVFGDRFPWRVAYFSNDVNR